MAKIEIRNLTKRFRHVVALQDVSFTVNDQELFAVLGPSGAGKTTLLRIIAGVETPTAGDVYLDDVCATRWAPEERQVAMVFEDYLLYPHLTVRENLGSSLRVLKWSQDDRNARISEIADALQIGHLLDRYPGQLSGGQKQRVALGRALVKPARVYLLDEPIAHLDAKLRHRMRGELTQMCRQLRSTIIYVTHDYREALAMADRVLVLNSGQVVQIGFPKEIYARPATRFVADFVGDPPMNLIDGVLAVQDGRTTLRVGEQELALPESVWSRCRDGDRQVPRGVTLGIRAQHLEVRDAFPGGPCLRGKVYVTEVIGRRVILTCSVNGMLVQAIVGRESRFDMDQTVWLVPDMDRAVLFDLDSAS
ncbi:MAG: ABC transporter ATP-binding protein [Firmicutes bacterium]|nr:ABC transporter ATP-binding protein [Bacillota bacterium]MDH7494816.1 ABC transporter ATP-binding protein [Bacillota bacterium]